MRDRDELDLDAGRLGELRRMLGVEGLVGRAGLDPDGDLALGAREPERHGPEREPCTGGGAPREEFPAADLE